MKVQRLTIPAALCVAALSLTACSQSAGDAGADPATDGVNTEAPLYDLLPDHIKDAGVITMAGDTHPPYRTIEADGSFTGVDPDLQAALAEQLGVPFQIETASGLDSMLSGMLSGRYDGFNGPIRATEEREAQFDAVIWITTRTSYVYLADRADELGAPEDLCEGRVAGVTGSVTEVQLEYYSEWCVEQGLGTPEVILLADSNATFLAVQSDRADYAATTQGGAIDLMAQDPGTFDYLVQSDEQGAAVDLLGMFLPKDGGLAEPMLQAMQAIFDNGEYERIMTEWDMTDVMIDEPILNPNSGGE